MKGVTPKVFASFWFTWWLWRCAYVAAVQPVLAWTIDLLCGVLEEVSKSIVRESFAFGYRTVNGVSAIFVSLFLDRSFYKTQREQFWAPNKTPAQHGAWGQMSTLNAFVEKKAGRQKGECPPAGPSNGSSSHHHSPATPAQHATNWWRPSLRRWARGDRSTRPAARKQPVAGTAPNGRVPVPPPAPSGAPSHLFKTDVSLSAINNESGVFEDIRQGLELGLTTLFQRCRQFLRRVLLVQAPPAAVERHDPSDPHLLRSLRTRRSSISLAEEDRRELSAGNARGAEAQASRMAVGLSRSRSRERLSSIRLRSSSVGRIEEMGRRQHDTVITAADLIHKAGYPVEEHQVTTSDGYVLLVDRIPRPGSRQAAFFVHGVFDTSLSWVCNGVTGSQAFAAWDAGFDVWLGTSRSNPPRLHLDPAFRGPSYWNYSVNEFGMQDMQSQIQHIHNVKCAELGSGTVKLVMPRKQSSKSPGNSANRASIDVGCTDSHKRTRSPPTGPTDSWRSRAGITKSVSSETDLSALHESTEECRLELPSEMHAAALESLSSPGLPKLRDGTSASAAQSSARRSFGASASQAPASTFSGVAPSDAAAAAASAAAAAPGVSAPPPASRWVLPGHQWDSGLDVRVTSESRPPSGHLSDRSRAQQVLDTPVLRAAAADDPLPPMVAAERAADDAPSTVSLDQQGGLSFVSAHPIDFNAEPSPAPTPSSSGAQNWTPRSAVVSAFTSSKTLDDDACSARASDELSRRNSSAASALGSRDAQRQQSHGASAACQPLTPRVEQLGMLPTSFAPGQPPCGDGAGAPAQDSADTFGCDSCTLPPVPSWALENALPDARPGRQNGGEAASKPRRPSPLLGSPNHAASSRGWGAANGAGTQPGGASERAQALSSSSAPLEAQGGSCKASGAAPGRATSDGGASLAARSFRSASDSVTRSPGAAHPPDPRRVAALRNVKAHKLAALNRVSPSPVVQSSLSPEGEPYRLVAVGHSLGGAALLMYVITCLRAGRRHHLARLELLTPAGFVNNIPLAARPFAFSLPYVLRFFRWLFPKFWSGGFYLPSPLLRSMLFKLTADVKSVPALSHLIKAWLKLCMNGDSSDWDRAMQMPHYNEHSMPAVSLLQCMQMLQWLNTGRFQLYDYGSRIANQIAYGQPTPPDIADEYWRLNIPVDLAAGSQDGVISPACVKRHFYAMQAAGVKRLTYREFNYGHLDFTFAAKEELRQHVLECMQRRD